MTRTILWISVAVWIAALGAAAIINNVWLWGFVAGGIVVDTLLTRSGR